MTFYKVTMFRAVSVFESRVELEEFFEFDNNAVERLKELRQEFPDDDAYVLTIETINTED